MKTVLQVVNGALRGIAMAGGAGVPSHRGIAIDPELGLGDDAPPDQVRWSEDAGNLIWQGALTSFRLFNVDCSKPICAFARFV